MSSTTGNRQISVLLHISFLSPIILEKMFLNQNFLMNCMISQLPLKGGEIMMKSEKCPDDLDSI